MPITRQEKLLNTLATGVASGVSPITREEQYLAYIAGETATKPDAPITRKEAFLDKIPQGGGGGGGVTIRNQNKTITENGTYTADSGYTGLGTVTVDVQASGGGSDFVGNIVIAEDAYGISISHNLGVVPNYIAFISTDGSLPSVAGVPICVFANDTYGNRTITTRATASGNPRDSAHYNHVVYWKIGGDFVQADTTNLTISVPQATMIFASGVEYMIFCGVNK